MVIVGENEVKNGVCQVKNMKEKKSEEVELGELPNFLAKKIAGVSRPEATLMEKVQEGVQNLNIGKNPASTSNLELSKDGRFFRPKIS